MDVTPNLRRRHWDVIAVLFAQSNAQLICAGMRLQLLGLRRILELTARLANNTDQVQRAARLVIDAS